jgi:hypothetical protein
VIAASLRKTGVGAARATKPAARSVGRMLAAGGRKLTAYLRDKGVIPGPARSTGA